MVVGVLNILGVGDGFPNTSLVLVEHGYNVSFEKHSSGHLKDGLCPCTAGKHCESQDIILKDNLEEKSPEELIHHHAEFPLRLAEK